MATNKQIIEQLTLDQHTGVLGLELSGHENNTWENSDLCDHFHTVCSNQKQYIITNIAVSNKNS